MHSSSRESTWATDGRTSAVATAGSISMLVEVAASVGSTFVKSTSYGRAGASPRCSAAPDVAGKNDPAPASSKPAAGSKNLRRMANIVTHTNAQNRARSRNTDSDWEFTSRQPKAEKTRLGDCC